MASVVRQIQALLDGAGFKPGPIDGVWGGRSEAALREAVLAETVLGVTPRALAWGRKVPLEFRRALLTVAAWLMVEPDWLMACIAFESAETFRPDILNSAGSGAVGLIQFMPQTAAALGTSTAELAAMPAERQLQYVQVYFRPYRGRLQNLGDVYMAILWPAGIGKPDSHVLFSAEDAQRSRAYLQNKGLDVNRDARITRGEACAKVQAALVKGLLPANCWRP